MDAGPPAEAATAHAAQAVHRPPAAAPGALEAVIHASGARVLVGTTVTAYAPAAATAVAAPVPAPTVVAMHVPDAEVRALAALLPARAAIRVPAAMAAPAAGPPVPPAATAVPGAPRARGAQTAAAPAARAAASPRVPQRAPPPATVHALTSASAARPLQHK